MNVLTEAAAIDPERLRRLLGRMIDIYSPSGKEEELLEYLYGYLRRHGLPVQKQKVDEGRYNLVVLPEGDIQLCLVGHLDTVIAYDLEDYGFRDESGLITGLGAADMKGGCAAMIEAFVACKHGKRNLPPVALALVVGEEEEGDGARALAGGFQFNWAVIGEPTGLKPCLSNYGYMEIQISTKGKRLHPSLADREQNPIEAMLKLIMRIAHYIEGKRPKLIYNIRDLYTYQAGFVVPDHCDAWLDVHMPPESPIGQIVAEIEELFEQERTENNRLDGVIRFLTIDAGYELPEKGPVVEALREIFAKRTRTWELEPFRSHSDANRLWASGVRPILLGPGQLEKAHVPDESVSFAEVVDAAEIYAAILHEMGEIVR